ncbi:hypothetical protein BC833DRAFT_449705 [Globomyces pollinis-pini]|nr:hypothetical protein BC833DRAFT_449705 [Globomyces pollinis-pini]
MQILEYVTIPEYKDEFKSWHPGPGITTMKFSELCSIGSSAYFYITYTTTFDDPTVRLDEYPSVFKVRMFSGLDIIKVSPLRFKLIVDADEDKQGLFGVFRQSTVNLQLDSPISSVMYGVICNHREILVDILRSSPTFREDHKTKIKLEKRHLRELYLAQRSSIPPPQNIDNSKISEGQQQEKNSQSAQKLQESSNQTQSPTNSNNNPSISAANNDVWNSSRIMNTLKPLIGI